MLDINWTDSLGLKLVSYLGKSMPSRETPNADLGTVSETIKL